MLESSLCDYSHAYILAKGKIIVILVIKVIFKNCAPSTDRISEINNTQVDNAKNIDIVIPMCNLTKHSDNYSKTLESLWQDFQDIPVVNNNGASIGFDRANATDSLSFKSKITG